MDNTSVQRYTASIPVAFSIISLIYFLTTSAKVPISVTLNTPTLEIIVEINPDKWMPKRNAHTWLKDIVVPLVVALLGGGGIFGLFKGCQELTRSTPTVNSPQATATTQKNNSACRLQSGAYKAYVTRDLGLGLRAKPLKNDTTIKRINLNEKMIVLKKNQDGSWLYVCLEEETDTKGWVMKQYTKKIKQ